MLLLLCAKLLQGGDYGDIFNKGRIRKGFVGLKNQDVQTAAFEGCDILTVLL
jgi:hypothetical protein